MTVAAALGVVLVVGTIAFGWIVGRGRAERGDLPDGLDDWDDEDTWPGSGST